MARSRDWATRIYHEAQLHDDNSFVTLTYSAEHLPDDVSVSVRHLQLFMKRLRKRVGSVRFFGCGEYGEQNMRPHYHVIVFGHAFPDRTLWRKTPSGHLTYRSPSLELLWTYGHSEIGDVTHQSAGYVARYCLKKVNGPAADAHYRSINPITGELVQLRPEFICMSNRPGIGSAWYDQYSADAFPSDFLVVDGQKVPVPRYYAKKLKEVDDQMEIEVKAARLLHAEANSVDNTPERLETRLELQKLRSDFLIRSMESDQ